MACGELHLHFPSITDASKVVDLTCVLATFTDLKKEIQDMSAEMTNLVAKVNSLKTADASIIALLNGIAQQIRDNVDDKAAMLQLANDVDGETAAVTAAINANTPPAAPPTA